MPKQIIVKSPNGNNILYDISTINFIDIQKGDYVFVSELANNLKMVIINDSLNITFKDGDEVTINNIVKLISENSDEVITGLMDKLDTTAIAFIDKSGNYKEFSFFEKFLELLEDKILVLNDNIENKNNSDILDLNIQDDSNVNNDFEEIEWNKSNNLLKDGDDTFEVWTNDNVTVYIDTDITVTDI